MNHDGYHFCLSICNLSPFVCTALYLPIQIGIPYYQIFFWPMDHLMLSCAGRTSSVKVFSFSEGQVWCLLLHQIIWLSKAYKINSKCRGRNILSEVEKLAKGKSSITKELVLLIYCMQLFNLLVKAL